MAKLESSREFAAAGAVRTSGAFEKLVRPRGVAVIGASADPSRIGEQPLRALTSFGFRGGIYPVNPRYREIKGLPCFADVAAIPDPCDLAIVAVPSVQVAGVVEQCGKAGIGFAVVLSSGFGEIGSAGATLQQELRAVAQRSGVRVIGPNCQGVMNTATRMYGGFGTAFQNDSIRDGPLVMITQSGAFGFGVVTEASNAGIGFGFIASTGNEADVTTLDLIEHFLEQEEVEMVATYLEGIQNGRRLLALGERALQIGKPILVWKVGNSNSGSRAAASHTANLTSAPELYRAVFRQGGFVEVRETADLVDAARAFAARRFPRGRNVAVLTSSGGVGVLLADRCEEHGLRLPELSEATQGELRKFLPEFAGISNPVDLTGNLRASATGMNRAISTLLDDPDIDQVIVRKGSTVGAAGTDWAAGVSTIAKQSDKPLLISVLVDRNQETLDILSESGLAWFPAPGGAANAASMLYDFAQKKARYESRTERSLARQAIEWPKAGGPIGEHESKRLLAAYGISGTREVLLTLDAVAALRESPVGYPLALKIASADIPHKTEADGVRLGIRNIGDLKDCAADVVASARKFAPNARIDGVVLQEMAEGVEVILGALNDRIFGPVVVLGLGGIFAEALRDVTHRCAPIDLATAHVMIDELRGATLLQGVRGRAAADVASLADALVRLSLLASDHCDRIAEIDVNPLFVRSSGSGVVAADAVVVLKDGGDKGIGRSTT